MTPDHVPPPSGPRLGIVLPHFHALGPTEYVALAREAEGRGYHTAWMGEVSGADAFTLTTLIASHTERLHVATGVVPVQTRTPVVLGLTAATIGHVAPGRFALGLGISSRIIVADWHGLPFSPSLAQLREAVHIIRAVLSGERVNVDGRFFRAKNFRMTSPPPPRPVKIFLAALGPEALELAGEIADGVLLNWIAPAMVTEAVRHLEIGATRAKKSLTEFEIAAFVRTCVTDEPGPAREWLAREITGYAIVDLYASFFRRSGFGTEVDAVNRAWRAGDRARAVREISPRFLEALGVIGPEAFCRDRLAEFTRAGLTMPVVFPFSAVAPPHDARPSLLRTIRAFPGPP